MIEEIVVALRNKIAGALVLTAGAMLIQPAPAGAQAATVITGLRVTGWTPDTVGLAWDAPPGDWTYWVRKDSMTPESRAVTVGSTVFANFGSGPAGVYQLSVVALDNNNRQAASDRTVTVDTRAPFTDTAPPLAPPALTATAITATTAWASWPAVTDNSGKVANYEVSDDGGATWQRAFRQSQLQLYFSPSLQFIGLPPGSRRTLAVRAIDGAGQASALVTVAITTAAAADRTAPTAPGNFREEGDALVWDASVDDSGTVQRYQVFSADDPRLALSRAVLVGAGSGTRLSISELVDRCLLTPGTSYTVNLRAFDATGNISTASRTITFTA